MNTILSDRLARYAAEKYRQTLPLLGQRREEILSAVEARSGDERVLMEFLYGTMPLCDAADCEPELFYSYVRHALFLRRTKPWTAELPEAVFLNYVLCPRVNNEAIVDCRSLFYEMVKPLLKAKTARINIEETVKEINYWCAAQVSYAASDERTLDPVGVFHSGSGRCGEESTFLVSVLRSVGIAARQVYTPRWAHCDDNHAWAEVWIGGQWRFLGACEPEEVLDKGWFTNASSRAMLVHSRVFSDFQDGGAADPQEVTAREGAAILLNDTCTYAKTRPLTVVVKDSVGNPVSGARVSFRLLNGAEYFSIAERYTDEDGQVRLHLGLGSILLHVSDGNNCAEQLADNRREGPVEVTLSKKGREPERCKSLWQYLDHVAPSDFPMHPAELTPEQRQRGKERRQKAQQRRKDKLAALERQAQEQAGRLAGGRGDTTGALAGEQIREILSLSFGNYPQIVRFLEAHPEKEALEFLSVLTKKDYRDICAQLLEEHYIQGLKVREYSYETFLKGEGQARRGELFLSCVWNPRIRYEAITPYRTFLSAVLTPQQKEAFRQEPELVWRWIRDSICPETGAAVKSRNYAPVATSPAGVLRIGAGTLTEQRTLFVALCRTLGIPARLHPASQEAEYYRNHAFHRVEDPGQEEKKARLTLTHTGGEAPEYGLAWTIGRWNGENQRFETLELSGERFTDGALTLWLTEGIYRLITTVRLPDGNQLAASRIVDTADFRKGTDGLPENTLELEIRKPELSQMLEKLALEPFFLHRQDQTLVDFGEIMGEDLTLLAFLEEGAEPTEHVLNELLELSGQVKENGLKVVFVVSGPQACENPTLARAGETLGAKVYRDDFQELPEQLARRMYVDPEKLPLVLLISPDGTGRYASSGYNVGSIGLLLRIAGMVREEM